MGGHIVFATNAQIPDFSLVQYQGTEPDPSGDIAGARFSYNGAPLGFYEYVRVAVSGGKSDFNPVYELESTMRTLCNDLEDRRQAVDLAVKDGVGAAAPFRNSRQYLSVGRQCLGKLCHPVARCAAARRLCPVPP